MFLYTPHDEIEWVEGDHNIEIEFEGKVYTPLWKIHL